jgi:sodium-dependent dicarboxylate transporter 2/3/5
MEVINRRFAVVLFFTILVLLFPTPKGLSYKGKAALSALTFTALIFTLQPVSLPFASLMVFVSLVLLGVANTTQAFQTLSKPIVILILGSLFIAETLRKHKLTRRLALHSIVASKGNITQLLFGLMGLAALLSVWMENTATAAVLIPVAMTITNQIEDREQAREVLLLLVLGIAYSSSIGGMITVTGSASNAVASNFIAEYIDWSFLDWIKIGLPAFLFVFPSTWWILRKLVKVSISELDVTLAKNELENMGKLRPVEWEIIIVMNITVILWIIGDNIGDLLRLPDTALSPPVVSLISVAYLATRRIISWEDVKDVSWSMIFVIGAGLALGEAITRTGASNWLTIPFIPLLTGTPYILGLFAIIFLGSLFTNIVNNATVVAILAPILINIANQDPSLNLIGLVIPLTLSTTFGYSLPSASGRMALLSATGIVKRRDMMQYGFIVTIVSAISLTVFFYLSSVMGWI